MLGCCHLENSFELINYIQSGDLTTKKTLTYPCSQYFCRVLKNVDNEQVTKPAICGVYKHICFAMCLQTQFMMCLQTHHKLPVF